MGRTEDATKHLRDMLALVPESWRAHRLFASMGPDAVAAAALLLELEADRMEHVTPRVTADSERNAAFMRAAVNLLRGMADHWRAQNEMPEMAAMRRHLGVSDE